MKKNKKNNFIYDGYTEKGFIKATELNDDFRFEYRPMLIDKREILWEDSKKLKADLAEQKIAMGLVHQIVSWDIVDEKGQPADITARNLLRLKPALWGKMASIVGGYIPSDVDPLLEAEEQEQATKDLIESSLDKTASQLKEVADEKN